MAAHSDIGLSQPAASTITMKLGTVTLTRNSTVQHQELLTIADPESTNGLARVTDTTPDSTMWAQVVRQVGYVAPSTSVTALMTARHSDGSAVNVGDSTEAAIRVNVVAGAAAGSTTITVRQSTFADLNCRINAPSTANAANYLPVRITDGSSYISPGAEYSDGSTASTATGPGLLFNNSSNQTMRLVGVTQPLPVQFRTSSGAEMADSTETALRVNVVAGAAAGSTTVTVRQSTAADLLATVVPGSTTWTVQSRVTTSSGGAVEGSTTAPAVGVIGLHVRQVYPTLQSTTTLITSTASTAVYALVSSAASLRQKVFAYSITSTHTRPSTLVFMSSLASDLWAVQMGSGSSGVTGANLALSPPGFLFATAAANALNVRFEDGSSAASTQVVRVSFSYFSEA